MRIALEIFAWLGIVALIAILALFLIGTWVVWGALRLDINRDNH